MVRRADVLEIDPKRRRARNVSKTLYVALNRVCVWVMGQRHEIAGKQRAPPLMRGCLRPIAGLLKMGRVSGARQGLEDWFWDTF